MKLYIQFNALFLCKIFLFLSNFCVLIVLSNFFPKNVVGEFYYQISILSIIALFCNLGTDNSIFYFIKNRIFTTANILSISYKIMQGFLILAIVTFITLYIFYSKYSSYTFASSILFICNLLLQNILNAYFLSIKKGWKPQLGLIFINIIFIIYLFLNKLSNTDYTYLLNIYYGLSFVISILLLFFISAANKNRESIELPSKKKLKKLFQFGITAYITNSLFFLGANMDLIIVKLYCKSDLSAYVQATKIFQIFCSAFYLLYYPFMGQVIEANYHKKKELLMKSSRIICLILILVILPFLICCQLFLNKIFPANYIQIMMVLKYLSFAFFSTCLAYFYTSYFIADKMHKQNIISATIFLIIITCLCFLLIPLQGIKGGAIAYSIAISCSLLFDMLSFKIVKKVKFTDMIFFKKEDIKFIRTQ